MIRSISILSQFVHTLISWVFYVICVVLPLYSYSDSLEFIEYRYSSLFLFFSGSNYNTNIGKKLHITTTKMVHLHAHTNTLSMKMTLDNLKLIMKSYNNKHGYTTTKCEWNRKNDFDEIYIKNRLHST